MRRATDFEHDVIRDVDQRRNRALPRALEPLTHPVRCCHAGIDPANHPPAEAPAQIGRLDRHRQAVLNLRLDRREAWQGQRRPGQRGDFAGNAGDRHAMRKVGGELEQPQQVIKAKRITQCTTHRQISRQDQQPAMVLGQTEFASRTQHACALDTAHCRNTDLHATRQFSAGQGAGHLQAGRDIGCAANNLGHRAGADIDLADIELVGIRVTLDRHHLRHDHIGKRRRNRRPLFHFETCHGQYMRQFITGQSRIGVGPQPALGEFHGRNQSLNCSRNRRSLS